MIVRDEYDSIICFEKNALPIVLKGQDVQAYSNWPND